MKNKLIESYITDTFDMESWEKKQYINNKYVELTDKNKDVITIIAYDEGRNIIDIYLNGKYYQTLQKVYVCFERAWKQVVKVRRCDLK